MKKQISYRIVSLVFSVLVICFAIAFYAVGWTEPGSVPPGGNVPTPLNTGSEGQEKIGGLILNTGGFPNGLIIDQGNVGIGTTTPSEALDLASGNLITTGRGTFGQLYVANYIRRYQDSNTYILFNPDEIHFVAGGSSFLTLHEGAVDYIEVWHDLDVSGDIVASGTICDSGGANCIGSGGGAFQSEQRVGSTDISVGTAWQDMPDMSITIETNGSSDVLLMFTASFRTANRPQLITRFTVDGIVKATAARYATYRDYPLFLSMHWLEEDLPAGAHTFKVQWRVEHTAGYQKGASEYPRVFSAIEL